MAKQYNLMDDTESKHSNLIVELDELSQVGILLAICALFCLGSLGFEYLFDKYM